MISFFFVISRGLWVKCKQSQKIIKEIKNNDNMLQHTNTDYIKIVGWFFKRIYCVLSCFSKMATAIWSCHFWFIFIYLQGDIFLAHFGFNQFPRKAAMQGNVRVFRYLYTVFIIFFLSKAVRNRQIYFFRRSPNSCTSHTILFLRRIQKFYWFFSGRVVEWRIKESETSSWGEVVM